MSLYPTAGPPAPDGSAAGAWQRSPRDVACERSVFWQNIVQQTLASLPFAAAQQPELLDGRVAVLTKGGERIPIRSVHPVFACSVRSDNARERSLSLAVQCTIFRIETPSGEAFTLPLEEIRAIHTISDDLMKQIQEQAEQTAGDLADQASGKSDRPFGFAAFTSLAKQADEESEPPVAEPADAHEPGAKPRKKGDSA